MKLKELVAAVTSRLQSRRTPPTLETASYRLELPHGWLVDDTGKVASIRGPRGELLQVSSAASSASDPTQLREATSTLQATGRRALEALAEQPELKLVRGLSEGFTPSGIAYEEVVLRAPDGAFVVGFSVHGPRTTIIATLDAAPDQGSVNTARQAINSISFKDPR